MARVGNRWQVPAISKHVQAANPNFQTCQFAQIREKPSAFVDSPGILSRSYE